MREIHELLRQIALVSDQHVNTVARNLGVPATNVHAIGVLRNEPEGVSSTELSRALGLSPPATTALVNRLVASGHAERSTSPVDARRVLIRATPTALQHSNSQFEQVNTALDAVLADHDPEQVEAFTRMLTEIHDAFMAAGGSRPTS
ncbi:MarR family winged helix-turn-helix transcriptional regulator [Yimella sp. cx-51]|uniref:MarR family winged helix-turn-helix transcriptional regulator n=1 Tax=Yimella sp. cx-51 TaxID=2770551 RepID=UPI00198F7DFD|nr:MarR family transcriptional regulator [Yimella sp. cx-51]MBC9956456.1 MarR family transcriptional regulator [Yimella sp. cx-51]QTH38429.1 MarR family transcriptional regulator [Yimella sp. cx-51]